MLSMLAIALTGCGHATAPPGDGFDSFGSRHAARPDRPQPPPRPQFERPASVRFHMERHFDDLRVVEELLVAGQFDDARTRAFLLTKPASDPGMAAWDDDSRRVVEAAIALTKASRTDEACRRAARVAKACADCHVHVQKLPMFRASPALPPDEATADARMARHQWAVDRLWEGMLGASDQRWYAGLEVLGRTPLPFSPQRDAIGLANHLQQLARDAQTKRGSETLDSRATVYGEILVTCAACHSTLGARVRR
jgi:cytochrome c553